MKQAPLSSAVIGWALFAALPPLVFRRQDAVVVGVVVLWGHDAELTGLVLRARHDTKVVRVMVLRRQDALPAAVGFISVSHYSSFL